MVFPFHSPSRTPPASEVRAGVSFLPKVSAGHETHRDDVGMAAEETLHERPGGTPKTVSLSKGARPGDLVL